MDEQSYPPPPPNQPRPPAPVESPFWTIIAALLFLYFGFFGYFIPLADDPPIQRISIHAFNWMARIVGIGLLLAAALAYLQRPAAHPLNFGLAALAALGCLGAGAIWMANGYGMGLLILVFGLLNAVAARSSWVAWRRA